MAPYCILWHPYDRVLASTQLVKYQYQYSSLEYQYKYQYLSLKYQHQYPSFKYKYQYQYLKTVLKYSSSTSTSTQYYNPAMWQPVVLTVCTCLHVGPEGCDWSRRNSRRNWQWWRSCERRSSRRAASRKTDNFASRSYASDTTIAGYKNVKVAHTRLPSVGFRS